MAASASASCCPRSSSRCCRSRASPGTGNGCRAALLAALLALPALYAAFAIKPPPPAPPRAADAPRRAGCSTLPLTLLLIAYGGLGVGYVVQATYLPTLVRGLPALAEFSTLAWLIVGLAAAPSNVFWQVAAHRMGQVPALILAYLIQAGGLAGAGAVAHRARHGYRRGSLGATLVGITALGLQQARLMAGDQAPRALALMTASFGLGQVIGPLLGARSSAPTTTSCRRPSWRRRCWRCRRCCWCRCWGNVR